MKKNLLLLITLSIFTFSQAQNRIEKTGNDVNKDDTPYFDELIGSDATSFYTLRVDKNIGGLYQGNYSVDQISKATLSFVKRIATASSDTRTDMAPSSRMIKGKIYLFTKFNNKQKKTCDFVVDEISTTDNASKRSVLVSFPTDESTWYKTSFRTLLSPDSTKLAVISKHIDDITLITYDSHELKELGRKKLSSLKEKSNNVDFSKMNFKIDNSGNLFFSCFETTKFSLNLIPANEDKITTVNFSLKNNYETGVINFKFDDKNNQVYLYTVYYEKHANPKMFSYSNVGFFIAKIDQNKLTTIIEKYHPFSSDILNRLTCGKLDNGIGNWNSYHSNVTIVENSEVLVELVENSMASKNRGPNVNSMYDMSTKVSYDANEIIVSKLNAKLDLTWMKLIPRCNTFTNITNKSESTILSTRLQNNGSLKYYFIEHPKFEDKKIDFLSANYCEIPSIKTYPGTNIVEYSINKDGKIEKRVIYTNKKEWLIPEFYDINLGNDKYIVRVRDGGDERFSIINLN